MKEGPMRRFSLTSNGHKASLSIPRPWATYLWRTATVLAMGFLSLNQFGLIDTFNQGVPASEPAAVVLEKPVVQEGTTTVDDTAKCIEAVIRALQERGLVLRKVSRFTPSRKAVEDSARLRMPPHQEVEK
jgi:hypothetical protein